MSAMPLERLFQPDASLDIPQHSIVGLFQPRQHLSNFDQFLFRNHHNPPLSLVQHSEIPRPHLHASHSNRNVHRPRFSLRLRPTCRYTFTPDSEVSFCAELSTASDVSHSAVDDGTPDTSDLEPRGNYVS